VASERRLRLRRRAGFAVGVDADAIARWRDSLAAVDALVAPLGAWIWLASWLIRVLSSDLCFHAPSRPVFPAEILQDFAADVQQRHVYAARL